MPSQGTLNQPPTAVSSSAGVAAKPRTATTAATTSSLRVTGAPLHLLQAVTKAGVSHWPARRGNHRDTGPAAAEADGRHPTAPPSSSLALVAARGACAGGKSNHQRQQVITIASPYQRPRAAEEEQELSVHSNQVRPR